MNWFREAVIRIWKGTGTQPIKTSPLRKVPVLPKSLVIELGDGKGDEYRNKKCTCCACEIKLPLLDIFVAAIRFYYYPGQGFANGERVPLLLFDCPKCKERQYLAIFSDFVEIGMFGASPVMDPIPTAVVTVSVKYELHQDQVQNMEKMTNSVRVALDEDYYARIYAKI